MKDLLRLGAVAARHHAAHVQVVRPVDGHEQQLAIIVHGLDDGSIRQVGAALVRVVDHVHVAGFHLVTELFHDGPRRHHRRGGVRGHAIHLGHNPGHPVTDGARKVVHLGKDRRARGTHHGDAHFLVDRPQSMEHDRHGNGIHRPVAVCPLFTRHGLYPLGVHIDGHVPETVDLGHIVRKDHDRRSDLFDNGWPLKAVACP